MPLLKSLSNFFSLKKCGCTKKIKNRRKRKNYKGGYISGTYKKRSNRSNKK